MSTTWLRDRSIGGRAVGAGDAILLGGIVGVESGSRAPVADREPSGRQGRMFADALVEVAREIEWDISVEIGDDADGLQLRTALRELVAARDRQNARVQSVTMAARLERLAAGLSSDDLEEARYQFDQMRADLESDWRRMGGDA